MVTDELGPGESICKACLEITDDFDGIDCDECGDTIHPECGRQVEAPAREAGNRYCHECI